MAFDRCPHCDEYGNIRRRYLSTGPTLCCENCEDDDSLLSPLSPHITKTVDPNMPKNPPGWNTVDSATD